MPGVPPDLLAGDPLAGHENLAHRGFGYLNSG
jgi:hypothetical protein